MTMPWFSWPAGQIVLCTAIAAELVLIGWLLRLLHRKRRALRGIAAYDSPVRAPVSASFSPAIVIPGRAIAWPDYLHTAPGQAHRDLAAGATGQLALPSPVPPYLPTPVTTAPPTSPFPAPPAAAAPSGTSRAPAAALPRAQSPADDAANWPSFLRDLRSPPAPPWDAAELPDSGEAHRPMSSSANRGRGKHRR